MATSPANLLPTELTTPLLRRTAFLPNESLASLLARLIQLNFYTSSGLLRTIGRERLARLGIQDQLAHPGRLETFQQLAHLTGLPLEELYAASDQPFVHQPGPFDPVAQAMSWSDQTTRPCLDSPWADEHLRADDAAQFCPLCLKASAYHRRQWIPYAAAICLEHLCLLTDRCARCWHRTTVTDLVSGRCPTCQANLRRIRPVSIAHDSLGLRSQQVIQAWFKVATPPAEALAACHLPSAEPHVLYHLLMLLARQLRKGQADWPSLPRPLNGLANAIAATIKPRHRLTPEQAYFLYRSAFVGLRDWPEGFHQLLDAYGGYDEAQPTTPTRTRCLLRFQRDWLKFDWVDSPLAFVQRELLNYLWQRGFKLSSAALNGLQNVAWFVDRTDLWTDEQTAQVLNLSLPDLRRFAPHGSLAHCYWPPSRAHLIRFKRSEILAVKRRWAEGWSLADASSWLGVSVAEVKRLVDMGLLLAHNAVHEVDLEQGVFNPQVVRDFFQRIVGCLQLNPEGRRGLIPLYEAVWEVRDAGIDFAMLLQCVLDGQVVAYRRPAEVESLHHIDFSQLAILRLPDQLYAARGLVSGHHFAYEYGLECRLIREWVAAGMLQPALTFDFSCYFDQQQLKELAAQQGFVSPVARPVRKRRT